MMIQIANKVKLHHTQRKGKEKNNKRTKKIKIINLRNKFYCKIIIKFILFLKANLKMFQIQFHKYFSSKISPSKIKTATNFQKL